MYTFSVPAMFLFSTFVHIFTGLKFLTVLNQNNALNIQYSGMLKSERPKSKQCWNPNNRSFEQTCLDFGLFGLFNRSDFGIYSIRMPIMTKSERLNRIVQISDDIFCPKSEQIVRISALFSVRTNLKWNVDLTSEIRTCSDFGRLLYSLERYKVGNRWTRDPVDFLHSYSLNNLLDQM